MEGLDPPAAVPSALPQAEEPVSPAARIALGALAVVAIGLLLAIDSAWEAGFVYAACGIAVVCLAMAEFADLAARAGAEADRSLLVLGGAALFVLQWAGWTAPGAFPDPWLSGAAFLALMLMGLFGARVMQAAVPGALESVAVTAAGLLYVPLLIGFLTAIRAQWGVSGLITVLAICKGGSTGAYFVGKSVGRMPLAPTVSPRKTVAGAVGQLITSMAIAYALAFSPWAVLEPWLALVFGALVSAAAMVGDLGASLLKRQADVKDSGQLLPGLGGMLDMVDDVLFAAPVSYVLLLCCRSFLGG
jgi:phosphatidate cytidylyltransferase